VAIVELEGVEKRYGDLVALKDVKLRLEEGRIGLLGPNGAGKSTLLKTLLGLVRHDHGTVKVLDTDVALDPFGVRSKIGYMPEGGGQLPNLTAVDFARLAGELCGLPTPEAMARAHQVLHYVGLGEARYRRLGSFSTGMQQRARLAQALVGDPRLLLLDEPTSGLDPRGREEMLALILNIPRRTGASVILSTHILPDVERTCDQVVVLAAGSVLYAGALEPLLATDRNVYEVRVRGDANALRTALHLAKCIVTSRGSTMEVRVPQGERASYILKVAVEAGVQVRHLAPLTRTLDDAFHDTLSAAAAQGSVAAT
jgi:ABC-2 type transport system ATP-binding protein